MRKNCFPDIPEDREYTRLSRSLQNGISRQRSFRMAANGQKFDLQPKALKNLYDLVLSHNEDFLVNFNENQTAHSNIFPSRPKIPVKHQMLVPPRIAAAIQLENCKFESPLFKQECESDEPRPVHQTKTMKAICESLVSAVKLKKRANTNPNNYEVNADGDYQSSVAQETNTHKVYPPPSTPEALSNSFMKATKHQGRESIQQNLKQTHAETVGSGYMPWEDWCDKHLHNQGLGNTSGCLKSHTTHPTVQQTNFDLGKLHSKCKTEHQNLENTACSKVHTPNYHGQDNPKVHVDARAGTDVNWEIRRSQQLKNCVSLNVPSPSASFTMTKPKHIQGESPILEEARQLGNTECSKCHTPKPLLNEKLRVVYVHPREAEVIQLGNCFRKILTTEVVENSVCSEASFLKTSAADIKSKKFQGISPTEGSVMSSKVPDNRCCECSKITTPVLFQTQKSNFRTPKGEVTLRKVLQSTPPTDSVTDDKLFQRETEMPNIYPCWGELAEAQEKVAFGRMIGRVTERKFVN